MFVRIQAAYNSSVTGKPCGIFGAVHHLKQQGRLSNAEMQTLSEIQTWFEQNLPNPPFYEDGNPLRAITWFKVSATQMIERLSPLREICARHAVVVQAVTTDNRGLVVYEDPYQLALCDPSYRSFARFCKGAYQMLLGLSDDVCKSVIGCTLRLSETLLTLSLLQLALVSASSRFFANAMGEGGGANSKEKPWCGLRTEPLGVLNSIGSKRMESANGKCGSNVSWTKDYAYASKT